MPFGPAPAVGPGPHPLSVGVFERLRRSGRTTVSRMLSHRIVSGEPGASFSPFRSGLASQNSSSVSWFSRAAAPRSTALESNCSPALTRSPTARMPCVRSPVTASLPACRWSWRIVSRSRLGCSCSPAARPSVLLAFRDTGRCWGERSGAKTGDRSLTRMRRRLRSLGCSIG